MNRETSSSEIAPADFVRRIESREEIHILDVRAPVRLANGTIDIVPVGVSLGTRCSLRPE